MILVDIPAIEEMKEDLKRAAADSDEALHLLKRTLAEMQDDAELMAYAQAGSAVNALSEAVSALTGTAGRICSLKDIMAAADEWYAVMEHENINTVRRITAQRGGPGADSEV